MLCYFILITTTYSMPIYKIKKRNWEIITFDRVKIEDAIKKAIESVWWTDFEKIKDITSEIIKDIEKKSPNKIPNIEDIQNTVEKILIKKWHDEVAKAYILYRKQRTKSREDKKVVVEVWNTMKEYLDNVDWRINENANIGYSIWWLILKNSEKIVANYWLSHIYPEEVWNAHRNGDYHIHDLGMFNWYCAGWSLRLLLEEWFNWVSNKVESAPPNNLQSAVNQMVNFLWTAQNEWAWAQAFSSFDTYLSPFVHKYKKELLEDLKELKVKFETKKEKEDYIYKKVHKYVYQQMQNFIFSSNTPSRWWCQPVFSNITLDWTCPEDLKDQSLMLWWAKKWFYKKKFWELDWERTIINKVLINVYTDWDYKGRVFTFPIPTYNITEDFDWDSENVRPLFEMTAKYWLPYFQNFLWSQFKKEKQKDWTYKKVRNLDAYKPWAVRSMCCRLQLDLTELLKRWWWLFGSAEMTWSIWVITINMARIWYTFKGDREWMLNQVKYLMNLSKIALELKRKEITKWLESNFYPYTYRYLRSFRNHFSTIWINGMNEAIINFTNWKENIATKKWEKIAIEILDFMRDVLKDYQEETWNLYNLEATPSEWATYRFAKEDQKQMPDIIQSGTKVAPYYTNSSQLPVWFTDDPFEALEKQNKLQCKYTGWTVLHLYMWERIKDPDVCKNFIKKVMENYQLPYITISPTFSICPKHWYIVWEHDYCPKCDEDIWYTWKKFDMKTRKKYTDNEKKMQDLE